ncbi:MAG TPA: DUF3232 domain-containing protein [Syntrophomonadaceae bacterium]|nr:DUF3232 domain-containing protein [Syntrophomonadaceae bacterium]
MNEKIQQLLNAIEQDRSISAEIKERKKVHVISLVEKAVLYVEKVVKQSAQIQMTAGQQDRDTMETLAKMDASRSIAHDSFIAEINIVNRFCAEYSINAVYEGKNERRQQGDFALQLVTQYFCDRI